MLPNKIVTIAPTFRDFTFTILHSAFLRQNSQLCSVVVSSGEEPTTISAWYHNNQGDNNEPTPLSLNIPANGDHLFEGFVTNLYSTTDTSKGPMAKLDVQNPERSINGWVRLDGGSVGLNIYDVLNSAYLNNRKVVVAVHTNTQDPSKPTFITGVWYATPTVK